MSTSYETTIFHKCWSPAQIIVVSAMIVCMLQGCGTTSPDQPDRSALDALGHLKGALSVESHQLSVEVEGRRFRPSSEVSITLSLDQPHLDSLGIERITLSLRGDDGTVRRSAPLNDSDLTRLLSLGTCKVPDAFKSGPGSSDVSGIPLGEHSLWMEVLLRSGARFGVLLGRVRVAPY